MSKFEYSDGMVTKMKEVAVNGVTEEVIESLKEEFGYPRRSIAAKFRSLDFEVPTKPVAPPVFSAEETAELKNLLEANSGAFTASDIAEQFAGGKFSPRQINGKALSLEMTQHIKPAEKKTAPRLYTEQEEDTIVQMVEEGATIEDIAEALDKKVPSVRGKLLSMGLKAVQRVKKEGRVDPYEGIEEVAADMSVEELAAKYEKSPRGVKTVLTRRKLVAKDYAPKSVKTEE